MSRDRFRLQRLYAYLRERDIDAAVLADFEGLRNRSLRYLSGHPQDALLFVFAEEETVLVPWDVPLAQKKASVDRIVPYTDFDRSQNRAVMEILKNTRRVELSARFTYPDVRELITALKGTEIICHPEGLDRQILAWRSIKDDDEITSVRRACAITDHVIDHFHQLLEASGATPLSEVQLALEIEIKAMELGAEGLGFESLVAGPERSFGIHPFPAYTDRLFGTRGCSILDFGVTVAGYTSDVTLTMCRGPLRGEQKEMIAAVKEAYNLALSMIRPGILFSEVDRAIQEQFDRRGFRMPHYLGHCIGLDAHELPYLAARPQDDVPLQPGMVVALEPGLYDPRQGGVRLENDLLCLEDRVEVLTHAHILEVEG